MTQDDFAASLDQVRPPVELDNITTALWWQGKGDWERAHKIVQELDSAEAALVHAHLHRVEGDLGNAGYWYRRAGRPVAETSLDAEWRALVAEFLQAA